MRKKEREEYIERRADELARSGKYDGWGGIELAIRHEGFPEARQVLDSDFRRRELDEMCRQARAAAGVNRGQTTVYDPQISPQAGFL